MIFLNKSFEVTVEIDILPSMNEGDSYRGWQYPASSPQRVPAADGLGAPFTSQANRARPALIQSLSRGLYFLVNRKERKTALRLCALHRCHEWRCFTVSLIKIKE